MSMVQAEVKSRRWERTYNGAGEFSKVDISE